MKERKIINLLLKVLSGKNGLMKQAIFGIALSTAMLFSLQSYSWEGKGTNIYHSPNKYECVPDPTDFCLKSKDPSLPNPQPGDKVILKIPGGLKEGTISDIIVIPGKPSTTIQVLLLDNNTVDIEVANYTES